MGRKACIMVDEGVEMKRKLLVILIMNMMMYAFVACQGTDGISKSASNEDVLLDQETGSEASLEFFSEAVEAQEETVFSKQEENNAPVEPGEPSIQASIEISTESVENQNIEATSMYSFTEMEETKYASTSVNVRSLPDTTGDKLGKLSLNDELYVTGKCNETGWYRFEYNGITAYVSNDYVSDERVVQQAASASSSASSSSAKSRFTIPYMTNSGGTWYTDDSGLTCAYYSNSEGKFVALNRTSYTVDGLKEKYPIGQFLDENNGSGTMYICGCCGTQIAYDGEGIVSFANVESYLAAKGIAVKSWDYEKTGVAEWVGKTPDTWPHNIGLIRVYY